MVRSLWFWLCQIFVYKIPFRRARAWPSARASKGILHTSQILKVGFVYLPNKTSQNMIIVADCMQDTFACAMHDDRVS